MKYLIDENMSMPDKFLAQNSNYENVKYRLGTGVKDPEILQRADKNEDIIATKDIEFALDALIAGFKVWYHDQEKDEDHFLEAQKFDRNILD